MKCMLAVAAIAAFSVSSATAADLAIKAPEAAAIYNWTGFYIGGNAGYGWGRGVTSAVDLAGLSVGPHPTNHPAGGLGGVQVGYNYQFARNLVVGIQGDFSGFSANDSRDYSGDVLGVGGLGRYSTRIDWLSSVTGRLGYAANNVLFYEKGGAAWVRDRFHDTTSSDLGGGISLQSDLSGSTTRFGWTIGAGVEYGWTRNWTVGFEYDYYDFGSFSQALNGTFGLVGFGGSPGPATESLQYKQTLSVAKASLNYRF